MVSRVFEFLRAFKESSNLEILRASERLRDFCDLQSESEILGAPLPVPLCKCPRQDRDTDHVTDGITTERGNHSGPALKSELLSRMMAMGEGLDPQRLFQP